MTTPPVPPALDPLEQNPPETPIREAVTLDRWVGCAFIPLFILAVIVLAYVGLRLLGSPPVRLTAFYALAGVLVLLALFQAIGYTRVVYTLPTGRAAFWRLLFSLTGVPRWPLLLRRPVPFLQVTDGRLTPAPNPLGPAPDAGGPGLLVINPGSVALLETIAGPGRVLDSDLYSLNRFERIKAVYDLEEQVSGQDNVVAMTLEGIQVRANRVTYRYRLFPGWENPTARDRRQRERSLADPYPFSPRAVRLREYNRTFTGQELTAWDQAVGFAVSSAITDFISASTLDDLIVPELNRSSPRRAIRDNLLGQSVRARLMDLGAELLECDIGEFELADEEMGRLLLERWQVGKAGDVAVQLAEAEARREAEVGRARARGQARVLNSIQQALVDINMAGLPAERMRTIILSRLVGLFESLGGAPPRTSAPGRGRPERNGGRPS